MTAGSPAGSRRPSLSLGKVRRLQRLATADGVFAMCAMDHRGSMQRLVDARQPERVGYDLLAGYKVDLCTALAPESSAVLLDPAYGIGPAIATGALPRSTGLLVSSEATGYDESAGARLTSLLADWSVTKTLRVGADGAKLLVYYRPDLEDAALRQREVVTEFAAACGRQEVAALVEAVTYPAGESAATFGRERPGLVLEGARELTAIGIDVFKAEFPADLASEPDEGRLLAACEALDDACRVPWVLLSAGVSFEDFARQVGIACRAGASGFLGGRAVWQEAFGLPDRDSRRRWLETVGAGRMRRLARLAGELGRPWWRKWGLSPGALAPAGEDWYQRY